MKHFLSNLSNLSIILLRLFGGLTGKLFGLILDKYADEPFKESLEKSLEEFQVLKCFLENLWKSL